MGDPDDAQQVMEAQPHQPPQAELWREHHSQAQRHPDPGDGDGGAEIDAGARHSLDRITV
jgi:hypothetical protein